MRKNKQQLQQQVNLTKNTVQYEQASHPKPFLFV